MRLSGCVRLVGGGRGAGGGDAREGNELKPGQRGHCEVGELEAALAEDRIPLMVWSPVDAGCVGVGRLG